MNLELLVTSPPLFPNVLPIHVEKICTHTQPAAGKGRGGLEGRKTAVDSLK